MRDIKMKTDPFEFITIIEIKMNKRVNEHSTAIISGYINEQNEKDYLEMGLKDTQVKIDIMEEGGECKTLFYGVIISLSIEVAGGLKLLTVKLSSGTYLMDINVHTRLFQDANMKYSDVFNIVKSANSKSDFIFGKEKDWPIKGLIMQYQETDWEFIKRVASQFNACVIPAYEYDGIRYYIDFFGTNKIGIVEDTEYEIKKEIGKYQEKTANGLEKCHETDETYIIFHSREAFGLGDEITFQRIPLYIHEIQSEYRGEEMIHTYSCKTKRGFEVLPFYNWKSIGISLEAVITDVKEDKVKIDILEDENISAEPKKLFPYATVYSSPDGTGWYCMPEIGDRVRLYLPSYYEEEAYVISAVHLDSEKTETRSDPDIKYMKNKQGKEVRFTPDSLILTNNNGMSISILDKEGIVLESDKSITISAKKDVDITSTHSVLTLMASEQVEIKQGGTALILDDNIELKGGKLKMQ